MSQDCYRAGTGGNGRKGRKVGSGPSGPSDISDGLCSDGVRRAPNL
jgi:hypothetical protein